MSSIGNIERRLSQLPDPQDGLEECPFAPVPQAQQLIDALHVRPLGPSGRKLLNFLLTNQGLTSELEQLLRRVCSKIKQQVWAPGRGYFDGYENLDPDVILLELPGLILEEEQGEALGRLGGGIPPLPGDLELCRDILEPDELKELQARLDGSKPYPYNRPPDRLPFESVPGEETLD